MNVRRRLGKRGYADRISSQLEPLPRAFAWSMMCMIGMVAIIGGLIGCVSRPVAPPISWTTSKTEGCDIERIWSHTLDGLADLTDTELMTCETACKNKDREACVGAGLMLYAGATARKNRAEARMLFHKQCQANVGAGCIALWATDLEVDPIGLRSGPALDRLCSKGEKHACEALGQYFQRRLSQASPTDHAELAVKYQTAACNAGSLSGCTRLGELYMSGVGVLKDSQKAGKIFQQQCQKGHMLACMNWGMMYKDGRGVLRDAAKSLELLGGACAGGVPNACYEYGKLHWFVEDSEDDRKVDPVDVEIALGHFHKACLGGIGDACHELALAYRYRYELVRTDVALAIKYDEVACKHEVGDACNDLGERYYQGLGVEKDEALAVRYFERGCSYGNARSCRQMGKIYLEGLVVERNERVAQSRFVDACAGNDTDSCYQAAKMMVQGIGGFEIDQVIVEYFIKACDGYNRQACNELNFYHHYREFQPTSKSETEGIYLNACHAGKMRACMDLGSMYRDAGSDEFLPKAAVLFQKACDGRMQEGCLEVGEAYFEGRGVTQDEVKGLKIDTDACHAKYAWACYLLGVRYRDGLGVKQDEYKAVILLDEACLKVEQACAASEELRQRIKEKYGPAKGE